MCASLSASSRVSQGRRKWGCKADEGCARDRNCKEPSAGAPGRLGVGCRGREAKRQRARGRHAHRPGGSLGWNLGAAFPRNAPQHHLGLRVLITLAFEEPSEEVAVSGWKVLLALGDREL